MQTFLPYKSFEESASCLDYRRLGKQRVEAMQLVRAIEQGGGWSHHPAVKMWKDYVDALKMYHNVMIFEWTRRGYRNNMPYFNTNGVIMPLWLGSDEFHTSHKSNLLRKDPIWYGKFGWDVVNNLPYVWPI